MAKRTKALLGRPKGSKNKPKPVKKVKRPAYKAKVSKGAKRSAKVKAKPRKAFKRAVSVKVPVAAPKPQEAILGSLEAQKDAEGRIDKHALEGQLNGFFRAHIPEVIDWCQVLITKSGAEVLNTKRSVPQQILVLGYLMQLCADTSSNIFAKTQEEVYQGLALSVEYHRLQIMEHWRMIQKNISQEFNLEEAKA